MWGHLTYSQCSDDEERWIVEFSQACFQHRSWIHPQTLGMSLALEMPEKKSRLKFNYSITFYN